MVVVFVVGRVERFILNYIRSFECVFVGRVVGRVVGFGNRIPTTSSERRGASIQGGRTTRERARRRRHTEREGAEGAEGAERESGF